MVISARPQIWAQYPFAYEIEAESQFRKKFEKNTNSSVVTGLFLKSVHSRRTEGDRL